MSSRSVIARYLVNVASLFMALSGMNNFSLSLEDSSEVSRVNNVPSDVSFLAPGKNLSKPLSSISIHWNKDYQHGFIDGFQTSEYYEDYLMTSTCSQSIQRLQLSQVDSLVAHTVESLGFCNRLLEVGCGDGSFLQHAASTISYVLGIEPSRPFYELAKSRGLSVMNTYMTQEVADQIDDLFDSFVSRQVFEHLPNPLEVLLCTKRLLKPGAVGLIEVPNGYRALRNSLFYEIFPDHVNYYSVNSLVHLASSAGFNVISCNEAFNGHYLELWLRNDPDICDRLSHMPVIKSQICNSISLFCNAAALADQKICIWGCGAKTMSIIPGLSRESLSVIDCIVDSDPHKVGLFVPNTSIQIVAFDEIKSSPVDKILILALSYVGEIVEIIKSTQLDCQIYTISVQGEIYLID